MIELVNNKTWVVQVNDLGIELQPTESIDLENLSDKEILESIDLSTTTAIFKVNDVQITYSKTMEYIRKLTHIDHVQKEKTHAHNVRESSFFDTEKVNGMTSKITYYKDVTKMDKVREEEIIRDVDGSVSQIKSTIFKDGEIEEVETQTLNRVDGRVDSISTELING
jgi:L-rhamnose mutarotase